MRLPILIVLMLSALSACGFNNYRDDSVPITSFADLDVGRYSGLWYEIASFPVPFQAGCVATTAEYAVLEPGRISVRNTCREDTLDGPIKQIEGEASVTGPGQLAVRFYSVPFINAPYWVLWVDENYQTAVVGSPSGRAGWILGRTPEIDPAQYQAALAVLVSNGYDVSQIRTTLQPGG